MAMNVLNYKLYYFLGIGGIGMSALARFFRHYGKVVHGYDRTPSELTRQMIAEGIHCSFDESDASFQTVMASYKPSEVLVVYTPAVPKSHPAYAFFDNGGYTVLKRSQVLGGISDQFRTIAIAGTHGKTTTTTLVTHLLKSAGINCFSFMGGISKNYNTNLLLGDINDANTWFVVEADEYDRSFLTLHPQIALITSVDADHLDIYGDAEHVKESYRLFAAQVKPNGVLVVKKNVDNELRLSDKRLIYSLNLNTDYCAQSIVVEGAQLTYDIQSPVEPVNQVSLGVPGLHNVENSVAATAIAQQLHIRADVIREALRSFSGVKRRFDYHVKRSDCVYIDDYAHHPEELKAFIGSVRRMYPGKKITGVFQPHLFSRTRDFADEFAASLDLLDACRLLDIYPAREQPLPGVTSAWLLDKMKIGDKKVVSRPQLLDEISRQRPDVLLTMGAGDVDSLVEPLEKLLTTDIEKSKL